jgi:hypothetical protein
MALRVQWNELTPQYAHLVVHPQDMLEATLNEAATLKRLLDGMKVLQSQPDHVTMRTGTSGQGTRAGRQL